MKVVIKDKQTRLQGQTTFGNLIPGMTFRLLTGSCVMVKIFDHDSSHGGAWGVYLHSGSIKRLAWNDPVVRVRGEFVVDPQDSIGVIEKLEEHTVKHVEAFMKYQADRCGGPNSWGI